MHTQNVVSYSVLYCGILAVTCCMKSGVEFFTYVCQHPKSSGLGNILDFRLGVLSGSLWHCFLVEGREKLVAFSEGLVRLYREYEWFEKMLTGF